MVSVLSDTFLVSTNASLCYRQLYSNAENEQTICHWANKGQEIEITLLMQANPPSQYWPRYPMQWDMLAKLHHYYHTQRPPQTSNEWDFPASDTGSP